MIPQVTIHPWSKDALFQKAAMYIQLMESTTADDWQYGFWSALSLELLARAALAHISPTLLADVSNWRNLSYALGHAPTAKKFSPTSVGTKDILGRLSELLPEFTEEIAGFCTKHVDKRNAELHSGELAFAAYGTSQWLPKFYLACKVLLESMGKSLSDLVSDAATAQTMIDSLGDAAAKAVSQDIKAHAQVWSNRDNEDRLEATARATAWATRQTGHRVNCPACNSPALLHGTPSGPVTTTVSEDEVVQRQTVLPATFECIACGLRITGYSKLSACGLGDAFTAKSTFTAGEFFGLYTEDELEEARQEGPDFEPDFNEY
jgi:hypothetical protein